MKTVLFSLILTSGLLPFFCIAQDKIIDAPLLEEAILFDGKVEEKAWRRNPVLPYRMQIPNYGEAPSESCSVYLAYDEDYLYLAGDLHLSDSSFYRPTTFKRDAFDGTTDYFGLVIDSYLDKENAVAFFTGPTGFRWDGVVWNDAQGDSPMSIDWNTFWDVATAKSEDGWTAEMRIPWTSLRFQERDGEVIMGITSWWYIAAKNELNMYPLIPLNWGQMSSWKPSQMQEFRFRGIKNSNPLYITPYLLAGYQQNYELNEAEDAYLEEKEPTLEAGLDVKYGITSNLTLDLTVNTDFAQVEADDQQVNLTRFSLFFPEKRLFFQERASVFDFSFEDFNRLFYSRRVGISEDGDPVRIYGGARLVGRAGKFDLGFLSMQTAAAGDIRSENFGLLRLRRQIINSNSYLGAIFTRRADFKGRYHTAFGLDGIFRLFDDEYLSVKVAQTFGDTLRNDVLSLDPARIYLHWERRRFDGFNYQFALSTAGKDYTPAMGFELREDYFSVRPRAGYGWVMDQQSKLVSMQTYVQGQWLRNHQTGKVETTRAEAVFELNTKSGWAGLSALSYNREFVPESFDLSDEVVIQKGTYDFTQFKLFFNSPFQHLFGAIADVTLGQFYDGQLLSISCFPRIKLSSHMELEGFYQYNYARFAARNLIFNSHLGRLKANYFLNSRFSVAAFLQYNSIDKVFAGNVRLRYNPREGNDLFIVYNDLLNSDRHREIPVLPSSSNRAIILKYTYTFNL